jgi:DNA-binding CsgD family transcriptional regulator
MATTPTDFLDSIERTARDRRHQSITHPFSGETSPLLDAHVISATARRAAIATDAHNRIIAVNHLAAELTGRSAADTVGRNLQEVLEARDVFGNPLCGQHSAFHQMASRGEAPQSFELDIRTRDADRLRVAVAVVVVLEPLGGDHQLVYLMTPMRRRRRADEAIDRLLAQNPDLMKRPSGADGPGPRPDLSERQLEVLRLLAAGNNVTEIASELDISAHTVRSHLRRIFEELEVSSQVEAVVRGLREGLI